MKKKLLFLSCCVFAILGVACLSSCSNDDDDYSEMSICGEWECVSIDYGEWDSSDVTGTDIGDILYLNEDHTYKIRGSYSDSGQWSLNGNRLTFTKGDSWTYTVTQCTKSRLTIVADLFDISFSFKKR